MNYDIKWDKTCKGTDNRVEKNETTSIFANFFHSASVLKLQFLTEYYNKEISIQNQLENVIKNTQFTYRKNNNNPISAQISGDNNYICKNVDYNDKIFTLLEKDGYTFHSGCFHFQLKVVAEKVENQIQFKLIDTNGKTVEGINDLELYINYDRVHLEKDGLFDIIDGIKDYFVDIYSQQINDKDVVGLKDIIKF